ncbi:MAG: hypothetical protein HOB05_00625 [Bacteroidetes bacterium]|nr:hypothetical protein [Bacteroidota bacterium]MBT7141783.1 hypothetical protein [Bacteroidota bacterium]
MKINNSIGIIFSVLLLSSMLTYSQNLSIKKNRRFSSKGYILNILHVCEKEIDNRSYDIFVKGKNSFCDSLYQLGYPIFGFSYIKPVDSLFKQLHKNRIFIVPRSLMNFEYPVSDSLGLISHVFKSSIIDQKLICDSLYKPGAYYRIEKVKIRGWRIKFKRFYILRNFYSYYSSDSGNNSERIGCRYFKMSSPYPNNQSVEAIVEDRIYFYNDRFLTKFEAELIDLFYEKLYIGPKVKVKKSYPEALKQIRKIMDVE